MTLKEHIEDIRDGLKTNRYPDEAAVSQGIVLRLLGALGWSTYDTQAVFPQYGVEGRKVDFALCHPPSKSVVFVEVKRVGNIEGAERQLFEYAFHEGVPIAVLTDGKKWQFFHPSGQGNYRERKVHQMDLTEGDSEESARYLDKYLNYKSVRTGKAVEEIKKDYEIIRQQRQVEARLPEVWNELVQERNDYLLLAVMEKAKKKIGHEPTEQQVLDFLKSLEPKLKGNGNGPPPGKNRNPGLLVTMPNGEIINHKISATTFTEVIEKLGIERVRDLKHKVGRLLLISTSKDAILSQRKSGQYYIMTNTSTGQKKALIEKIATDLGKPLKVEVVEKL